MYVRGNPVAARDPDGYEPITILAYAFAFYVGAYLTDSVPALFIYLMMLMLQKKRLQTKKK